MYQSSAAPLLVSLVASLVGEEREPRLEFETLCDACSLRFRALRFMYCDGGDSCLLDEGFIDESRLAVKRAS